MPILTSLALASIRGFGFGSGGAAFDVLEVFTSTRSFTIPDGVSELEYVVIAGGGAGGGDMGGGGGAGGLRIGSGLSVNSKWIRW